MKLAGPLSLFALTVACGAPHEPETESSSSGVETHLVRGQYLFHSTEGSTTTVTINHEEIPGFMDAMAMPYVLNELELVEGLEPGEDIQFRVVVEPDGLYFVDEIVPLSRGFRSESRRRAPPPPAKGRVRAE